MSVMCHIVLYIPERFHTVNCSLCDWQKSVELLWLLSDHLACWLRIVFIIRGCECFDVSLCK